MKKQLNKFILGFVAVSLLTACANDDDYNVPDEACTNPGLVADVTPQEVLADNTTDTPVLYDSDDIVAAYVTSSDERGTFFKSVSLQTKPTDGSQPFGFSISIDDSGLFGEQLRPGNKVYIKLKGLYTAKDFGSLKIGAFFQEPNEDPIVGRIPVNEYVSHVFVSSCEKVSEDELVKELTIAQALNDSRLNTLIDLKNVQFENSSIGLPYYKENLTSSTSVYPHTIGGATNHRLVDEAGNAIIFRTSSFANFGGSIVPKGSGTVRGVLTKFLDTYQFIPRYESDVRLDKPRFGVTNFESETAKGGTSMEFSGMVTEDFEDFALNANSFPDYINDVTVGNRYWQIKQFPANTGNKYIEMTSFAGGSNPGVAAKSYFFVPVNFTNANTFSFSKEIRFMAGQALKVYYVTEANHAAGDIINVNEFIDITSSFTNLIYPATGQSQNTFTTAGTYSIPSTLTGNGFFVFEYSGSSTVTTTIQIDDIVVN